MDNTTLTALFTSQQSQQPILLLLLPTLLLPRLLPSLSQQCRTRILIDHLWLRRRLLEGVLGVCLCLEDSDFVLEAVIDALLLLEVEGGVCTPGDLSMRREVHVGWLFRFYFSFIHDSRS